MNDQNKSVCHTRVWPCDVVMILTSLKLFGGLAGLRYYCSMAHSKAL